MAKAQIGNNNPEHNLRHTLVYQDLREWIAEADRLGELRDVKGASWEQDIGLACTVVKYDEDAPVLLFDEIPGVKPGFRVLANFFGGKRLAKFAPTLANGALISATPKNAGKYTKPQANGSCSVCAEPKTIFAIAAVKAMGTPQAAEVATACCMLMPFNDK